MIIFYFKRDTFLRETIVYSPAPSTTLTCNLLFFKRFFSFLTSDLAEI